MKVKQANVAMKGIVESAALGPKAVECLSDAGVHSSQSSARVGNMLRNDASRTSALTVGMHVLLSGARKVVEDNLRSGKIDRQGAKRTGPILAQLEGGLQAVTVWRGFFCSMLLPARQPVRAFTLL